MVERAKPTENKLLKPPKSRLHSITPALLKTRTDLPYNYSISQRWHVDKGYESPEDWKGTIPKDVTRVPVFMGVPGYGCNTITTEDGQEISYYSWFFDELADEYSKTAKLAGIPPMMHSFCWPGSHMSVQETKNVQKSTDPYSIKYQPAIFMQMLDQFVRNSRKTLPPHVNELDATILSHSMGARAAIQAFHDIGQVGDGEELKRQIDLLASKNGFDRFNLNAVFMAPAFGLAPPAKRTLRLFQPMEMADRAMEKLAKHVPVTGTIFDAYRKLSEAPFRATLRRGLSDDWAQFVTGLEFGDPTGFLRYFADNNNPHLLVRQGHEIMAGSHGIDVFSLDNIENRAGIRLLTVSHGRDNFVDTSWAAHTFGKPSHSDDPEWHNPTHVLSGKDASHTKCLENPAKMARIVLRHAMSTYSRS